MEGPVRRKGILPWILAGAVVGVLLATVIIKVRSPGAQASAVAELDARTPPAQAVAPQAARPATPKRAPAVEKPVPDAGSAAEPAAANVPSRRRPGRAKAEPAISPWSTAQAVQNGRLSITSDPAGAMAYVDGKMVGITPVTVELPFGTYDVRIQHEGEAARQKRVPLQSAEFSVPFTPMPSRP